MATAEVTFAQEVASVPDGNGANAATKEVTRLRDLKTSARDQLMIDPRIILIDDSFNPRNYDLPENEENYVHRVGRTGRGTKKGQAFSFCSPEELEILEDIGGGYVTIPCNCYCPWSTGRRPTW